MMHNVSYKQV